MIQINYHRIHLLANYTVHKISYVDLYRRNIYHRETMYILSRYYIFLSIFLAFFREVTVCTKSNIQTPSIQSITSLRLRHIFYDMFLVQYNRHFVNFISSLAEGHL